MSIVGTRPPLISETNLYEPHHKVRLAIKPGITGMWQVSGRSDITDFEEVVRLDKEYIEKPNAPQYIMDITPAVQELGYHPQYNYLEMLQDFKKEMQLHKINGGGYRYNVICLFAAPQMESAA